MTEKPGWIGELADDVTMEAAVLTETVVGKEAVLALLSHAVTLYEFQDFAFAGPYGEHNWLEDYTSSIQGVPIASIAVIQRDETGQVRRLLVNHRPLPAVLLFSRLMAEHFRGTPYERYFQS